ncbi:MAG: hypothetical protein HQK91_10910 [Nitrospirae bacterium]|nr:hypothetical protein [Nitrospirota bacterium]
MKSTISSVLIVLFLIAGFSIHAASAGTLCAKGLKTSAVTTEQAVVKHHAITSNPCASGSAILTETANVERHVETCARGLKASTVSAKLQSTDCHHVAQKHSVDNNEIASIK